ncbi:MAG TPA: hypothetical protein VF981_07975 [Gemmatimonadaceae bacterium]
MSVQMTFGLLADYAATGQRGKLTIVHVFNRFNPPPERIGQPIGSGMLVACIEGGFADLGDHRLLIRLRNADEELLPLVIEVEGFTLNSAGPDVPPTMNILIQLAPIPMPPLGDYRFELSVDDAHVGFIPFYVLPPRNQPRAPGQ